MTHGGTEGAQVVDMQSRAIGVDFGTSTSLVAEREGPARAEVLPLGFQLRTRFLPPVAALRGAWYHRDRDTDRPWG